MKRILTIVLVLIMSMSFVSCNNIENNSTSEIIFDPNNAQFYLSGCQLAKSAFRFSNASTVKLWFYDDFETYDDKATKEININIFGNQVSLQYDKTTSVSENLENASLYNRAYDWYKNDWCEVAYCHGTNDLTEYKVHLNDNLNSEFVISESEAKLKAEQFISSVQSADWRTQYKIKDERCRYTEGYGYTYLYRRTVCGYEARDNIVVVVSPSGEIRTFGNIFRDIYDGLESKVTKEILDTAKQTLRGMVESMQLSDLEYGGEPDLAMNADGELFMYQSVTYKLDIYSRTDTIYLKIGSVVDK